MMRKTAIPILLLALAACAAKRYFGRGIVLDVDREAKSITVSHDRIPGYMEPMIMPFHVQDPRMLEGIERGHRIHFRLAVDKLNSYLDHVMVVSAPPANPAKWQNPVVSSVVDVGEPVPDFELTDQSGQRVSLSEFRGKLVAVTFIYARCPLPDYCPRITGNFAYLRNRFRTKLGQELALLSVTFDPQHDTPEVLRDYARAFGAVAQGWYFLTGAKEEIARICGMFGAEFWPDDGQITHNLEVGLIDRQGRMAASVEGREYTAEQLGDLVEHLLNK